MTESTSDEDVAKESTSDEDAETAQARLDAETATVAPDALDAETAQALDGAPDERSDGAKDEALDVPAVCLVHLHWTHRHGSSEHPPVRTLRNKARPTPNRVESSPHNPPA